MANFTTTNVLQTSVTSYMEGLRMVPMGWEQAYEVTNADVPSLRIASFSGVGELPVWSGDEDISTTVVSERGSKTLDYVQYALEVRIPKLNARDVPGLVEQAARKLGIAVASTRATVAAAKLNNAFGTTTTADGQALCSTAHTTRSGATRSNKLTSAFDRTALFAALSLATNWESYENLDYDIAELGWYLIWPTSNTTFRETVTEVLGSSYSSSEMQVNAAQGLNITPIGWQKLTDSTHWHLISKAEKPLVLWDRIAPEETMTVDTSSRLIKITADSAMVAQCKPQPEGIIGSDAA